MKQLLWTERVESVRMALIQSIASRDVSRVGFLCRAPMILFCSQSALSCEIILDHDRDTT